MRARWLQTPVDSPAASIISTRSCAGSNPTRYVPIAADHPLNLQLLGEGEDPEAFLTSRAYFLWKNPWGTYLRFTEREQRQCVRSGKSLYLYPP